MAPLSESRARQLAEAALLRSETERDRFLFESAGEDWALYVRARALAEVRDATRPSNQPEPRSSPKLARFGHSSFRLQELCERVFHIAVYDAIQVEPVHRRVTLKILESGREDEVQRFQVEQQALASVNHRNIARVLEVGHWRDKRAFLALEFVDGPSLEEYCERVARGSDFRHSVESSRVSWRSHLSPVSRTRLGLRPSLSLARTL